MKSSNCHCSERMADMIPPAVIRVLWVEDDGDVFPILGDSLLEIKDTRKSVKPFSRRVMLRFWHSSPANRLRGHYD